MIDQGGHASRVMAFDAHGVVLARAEREPELQHPTPDRVEQNADELVLSVEQALADCVAQLGEQAARVTAMGLATQRSSVVCWDRRTGEALSPVISWQDRRARRWMSAFGAQTPRIQHITGLLPTPHFGVSKLRWCLEQLPSVQVAHREHRLAWGPLASFLLYRLLTEKPLLVDPSNASRTLLWDVRTRDWSPELLAMFGLDAAALPRCVPSRHCFGHRNIAGRAVPLTVCMGDQSAALFAFGEPQTDTAYLNIGTGGFLQRTLAHDNTAMPGCLLRSVVWADEQSATYVAEATVNGAGSALLAEQKALAISPQQAEENLPRWLATASNIPLYLNGVSGLGSPFWVADFTSRYIDGTGRATTGEKLVAVVESILFLVQVNLWQLAQAQQPAQPVRRIVVSGGLAVLDGLCQRLANLSGFPVLRAHCPEATARGLARQLAASRFAQGAIKSASWRELSLQGFEPQPNPKLQGRYRRWCQALAQELSQKNGVQLPTGFGVFDPGESEGSHMIEKPSGESSQ
ncbi:MAG: hypothetical protein GXP17_09985 [Gammaproteobacteria bacterium]|nr:hypothetical protein [Gammaproteobacteria bacterium]